MLNITLPARRVNGVVAAIALASIIALPGAPLGLVSAPAASAMPAVASHVAAVAQHAADRPAESADDPLAQLRQMGSDDHLPTLLAGGLLAAAVWRESDPRRTALAFDGTLLDGPADLGNLYGSGVCIGGGGLGLLVAGRLAGSQRVAALGGDLVRAFALSGGVTWAIKLSVDRRRPGGGRHSFPSGHTAVAFAAAPVLSKHLGPGVAFPAHALACLTGAGRLEEQRHHLADVIFGAAIGWTAGRVVAGRRGWGGAHASATPGGLTVTVPF